MPDPAPEPKVVASAINAKGNVVPTIAEVAISSAAYSKINWTQIIAGVSSILVLFFGQDASLSPWWQAAIVTAITLVQGGVTWVFRTWFTRSIHPSSLPKGA